MKKILFVMLALSMCFSLTALDLSDVNDVKNVLDGYAQGLVDAIPTEVSADNLWADAYIGKLISIPPHFAIGVNLGCGLTNNDGILDSLSELMDMKAISKLPGAPVPAASFNARMGGIILPFDIGFHGLFAGINSDSTIKGSIDIKSWGIDFRYCIIEQIVVIPAVSVGIGYDVVDVAANMKTETGLVSFDFATKAKLLSGTAQVSWNLLFFKLFGGVRGLKPLGDGVKASAVVSSSVSTIPFAYTNSDFSFQLFGGFGLRMLVVDTTLGVTYDVSKGNAGGSISLRFQL